MYAKIFRQIYESSIAESPKVRFTFMDMLVLADSDGVVDMTPESIARITNRDLAEIKETICVLQGPDSRSRTPEYGGARIRLIDEHRDWGWVILNYDRFRDYATEAERKAKGRDRVRRHRENKAVSEQKEACNAPVTPCNVSVTPVYVSQPQSVVQQGKRGVGRRGFEKPTFPELELYAQKIGLVCTEINAFFDYWEARGWKFKGGRPMVSWQASMRTWNHNWRNGTFSGNSQSQSRPLTDAERLKEAMR